MKLTSFREVACVSFNSWNVAVCFRLKTLIHKMSEVKGGLAATLMCTDTNRHRSERLFNFSFSVVAHLHVLPTPLSRPLVAGWCNRRILVTISEAMLLFGHRKLIKTFNTAAGSRRLPSRSLLWRSRRNVLLIMQSSKTDPGFPGGPAVELRSSSA